MDSPFRVARDGLSVLLTVQPGAGRTAIDGPVRLADGSTALRARVTAPPHDGKANAEVIKLLAKVWHLPKSALAIRSGRSHRRKVLAIEGDASTLRPRLEAWLDSLAAAP